MEFLIWYSRTNIRGAQMWHDEIGAALRRCDWFVLVLSPGGVASPWVKRELLYLLQESRYAGRIVPLLHEPCAYDELSWTLASMQMVDFTRGLRCRVPRPASYLGSGVQSIGDIATMSSNRYEQEWPWRMRDCDGKCESKFG